MTQSRAFCVNPSLQKSKYLLHYSDKAMEVIAIRNSRYTSSKSTNTVRAMWNACGGLWIGLAFIHYTTCRNIKLPIILYVHATNSLPMNHPTIDLRHCFRNSKAIVCEDTESQASSEESFLHSCARQPSLPTPSSNVCTRHCARFDRTPHRMLLHLPGAGVRNHLDLRYRSSSTSCDGAVTGGHEIGVVNVDADDMRSLVPHGKQRVRQP
jgi:hypothetical protein